MAAGAAIALALSGCTAPSGSSGGSTAAPAPKSSFCVPESGTCGGGQGGGASAPAKTPPSGGVTLYGDYKFGDCSISLWPAQIGLTVVRNAFRYNPTGGIQAVVSEVCVGYTPSELTSHFSIERFYSAYQPGHPAPAPKWHAVKTFVTSQLPQIGLPDPFTGQVPFALQSRYSFTAGCIDGGVYRLRVDLLGLSLSGGLISLGGTADQVIASGCGV
jgi:hypothetical protein